LHIKFINTISHIKRWSLFNQLWIYSKKLLSESFKLPTTSI